MSLDEVNEIICQKTRARLSVIDVEISSMAKKAKTSKKAGVDLRRLNKEKTQLLKIEEGCRGTSN